jgi:hypothetical protein
MVFVEELIEAIESPSSVLVVETEDKPPKKLHAYTKPTTDDKKCKEAFEKTFHQEPDSKEGQAESSDR